MTTDVTGILRGTELLRSVPAEDLRALAAASRLRSFPRGQVLFTRNDPSDTVMVFRRRVCDTFVGVPHLGWL